jgi:hypothetical protein
MHFNGMPTVWPISPLYNSPQAGQTFDTYQNAASRQQKLIYQDYLSYSLPTLRVVYQPNATYLAAPRENGSFASMKQTEASILMPREFTRQGLQAILVRSIPAQMFLELNRFWIANTSSQWLFERVESARANIKTNLPTTHLPFLSNLPGATTAGSTADWHNQVSAELVDASDHYQSDDYPYEKQTIMDRMNVHQPRGIESRRFEDH